MVVVAQVPGPQFSRSEALMSSLKTVLALEGSPPSAAAKTAKSQGGLGYARMSRDETVNRGPQSRPKSVPMQSSREACTLLT